MIKERVNLRKGMKINITYTSVLSSNIFFLLFLFPVLFYLNRKKGAFSKAESRLLLIYLGVLSFRLFFSMELPFTYSIYIGNVYAMMCRFLRKIIWNIELTRLLGIFSFMVSVLITIYKVKRHLCFSKNMKKGKVVTIVALTSRLGHERKIPVIEHKYVTEPFIMGVFKPRIIVPENISFYRDYILLHEIQHYINHDLLYKLVMEVLCTVYWWNPLVYIIKYYTSNIFEIRNDLIITENISPNQKVEYAEMLVSMAKYKHHAIDGIGLNGGKSFLKPRVLSILNNKKPEKYFRILVIFLIMLICTFFLIVEPSDASQLNSNYFIIEESDSYIVENINSTYDVFIDNEYMGTILDIPQELLMLPIISGK